MVDERRTVIRLARRSTLGAVALMVAVLGGCTDTVGELGGPCNARRVCLPGLVCEKGVCVEASAVADSDAGAVADSGVAGDGGSQEDTGARSDAGVVNTLDAPEPRKHHTAVWTGREMIVWGGLSGSQPTSAIVGGARYEP